MAGRTAMLGEILGIKDRRLRADDKFLLLRLYMEFEFELVNRKVNEIAKLVGLSLPGFIKARDLLLSHGYLVSKSSGTSSRKGRPMRAFQLSREVVGKHVTLHFTELDARPCAVIARYVLTEQRPFCKHAPVLDECKPGRPAVGASIRLLLAMLYASANELGVVRGMGRTELALLAGVSPRQLDNLLNRISAMGFMNYRLPGGAVREFVGLYESTYAMNVFDVGCIEQSWAKIVVVSFDIDSALFRFAMLNRRGEGKSGFDGELTQLYLSRSLERFLKHQSGDLKPFAQTAKYGSVLHGNSITFRRRLRLHLDHYFPADCLSTRHYRALDQVVDQYTRLWLESKWCQLCKHQFDAMTVLGEIRSKLMAASAKEEADEKVQAKTPVCTSGQTEKISSRRLDSTQIDVLARWVCAVSLYNAMVARAALNVAFDLELASSPISTDGPISFSRIEYLASSSHGRGFVMLCQLMLPKTSDLIVGLSVDANFINSSRAKDITSLRTESMLCKLLENVGFSFDLSKQDIETEDDSEDIFEPDIDPDDDFEGVIDSELNDAPFI